MKKVLFIIAGILFGLIILLMGRNYHLLSAKKIVENIDITHFKDQSAPISGEFLTFDVVYHYLIPIARPTIKTKSLLLMGKREAYPIILHAETGKMASKICKAYADIKSYVDKENLHTLRFEEISQAEGHSLNTKEIIYDQKKHIMTFEGKKRIIPDDTQDPLSLLIYLRTLPYEKGGRYSTYINSNQENYLVETVIEDRIVVNAPSGNLALWKLSLRVSSQKDYSKARCTVEAWVTDTKARYPVLVKAHTLLGTVIVALSDIE